MYVEINLAILGVIEDDQEIQKYKIPFKIVASLGQIFVSFNLSYG